MLNNEIIKEFGEAFISSLLYNKGFKVDRINDEGIDITCYKDEQRYGISVKSRNLIRRNNTINLTYNDIVYTYDNSLLRKLTPAYAFITSTLERIDVLIVTQKYVFENYVNIESIEKYKSAYKSKNDKKQIWLF